MNAVLRGITWEHSRGYGCMIGSAERYRAETGVDVRWEYRSLQAFADAPVGQLAADFDLLVIDHPHVPLAAEQGFLARLDGAGFDDELLRLSQQSVGRSHQSYAHEGHQYGLASDAAAQVSAFRPDLIGEVPENWDAVLELAREGRVLWPVKPIDAFSSLVTIAGGNGADINAAPGQFLAEDDALAALDYMHRLAALIPRRCFTANPIEVAELLSTSDEWCYSPLLFGYTNYSRAGFRPGRIRYTDIPTGPGGIRRSLLGGAGVAVSATATDLESARAFAFWVASAEVQAGVYYDAGGQPGNAAAWDDDRLNNETLDFFSGTRATLDSAYVRPRTAGYIEFQDTAAPWVTQALAGELTDSQLITRLNHAATELLVEA
jgi:multiple sugar transport system substrate-binding protein